MGQFEQFVKPAIAIWRAGIFFSIGLVIWFLSIIWVPPYAGVETKDRSWYYDIIDGAIGNLGNIARFILIAGLIYAVLVALGEYLWTSKLEDSIGRGFQVMSDALTIGSARISHNSVSKWIANSFETPEKYKLIAVSSLCKCYGAHSSSENSYLNYVVDNLIETHAKPEAITRHNCNITVVIRKVDEHSDLLQWEERKDYVLNCPSGRTSTPVGTTISARANLDNVGRLVEALTLTIAMMGVLGFHFKTGKEQLGI